MFKGISAFRLREDHQWNRTGSRWSTNFPVCIPSKTTRRDWSREILDHIFPETILGTFHGSPARHTIKTLHGLGEPCAATILSPSISFIPSPAFFRGILANRPFILPYNLTMAQIHLYSSSSKNPRSTLPPPEMPGSFASSRKSPTLSQTLFSPHMSCVPPRDSPLAMFVWRWRVWFECTFGLSAMEPWEKYITGG